MKNARKYKLIINLIGLVLTLCTSIAVVCAWYIGGTSSGPMIIQSANVSSKTTISKGVDFDYDGYPDIIEPSGLTDEQKKDYFTVEDMYFKHCAQINRINKNKTETCYSMDFNNVLPGNSYIWHIKVENNGDVNAQVSMLIDKNDIVKNHLKGFSVEVSQDGFANFGNKVFFGEKTNSSLLDDSDFVNVYSDDLEIKQGKFKDYLVRFTFEPFDVLIANNINITYQEYQALQGFNEKDPVNNNLTETIFFEVLLSSGKNE